MAILSYQFKKRWQILGISIAANTVSGISFMLLGGAPVMTANCFIAALQCLVNTIRAYFGWREAGICEKLFVFAVFLTIGIVRCNTLLDIMPLAAAMFFVLSTFMKNAQSLRVSIFFNAVILLAYSLICHSTVAIGHFFSIVSIVAAFLRERKACKAK